jgi:hypothetical protein
MRARRISDLRRRAETVQPVAQAHDRMFPHHARPGITHYGAGLFAAIALVAMHGTVGARRLFLSEAATFQPHFGVIQKLPAFRAKTFRRMMMVAAINLHHRRHRFPFAREAHACQVVLCLCGQSNQIRSGNQFGVYFHAFIFAQPAPKSFDSRQSFPIHSASRKRRH